MAERSIHIHEDDWGMRNLHPVQASGELAADVQRANDAGVLNEAPGGGWSDVYVIQQPSVSYADVGLTFAAADAVLAPIMPRVRRFAATIGAAIGRQERDPYGSYEDDAYCYGEDAGCFIKLDGAGDIVERIWFEARTDADGLHSVQRAICAIDQLAESAIADYWLNCSGRVRDKAFLETYMSLLAGKDDAH